MGFIVILILTTLSIAGSAAFFSIYGLAQIFTGSFWPVVIMATSLEAGKLVAASYVYRYWKRISFFMKSYLILSVLILMMITSMGIFGFLSSAYQQDVLPLNQMESRIELLDQTKLELENLKKERIARREQLNNQVSDLPGNFATKREIVRKQIKPELDQINVDLQKYSQDIRSATEEQHKLKTQVIQQRVHTGPIIFIAKAFNQEVDDATKWMIFLIIFAFDPLAVVLTIGANIAVLERKGKPKHLTEKTHNEKNKSKSSTPPADITNIPVPGNTIDQIRSVLEEMNQKPELTPIELAQKGLLEEMLRKREVTDRIRSAHVPKNNS